MVRRAIEEKWGREMREIPPREDERRMLEDMPGYQGAFNHLHYRYFPIASNPVLEWIAAEIEQHCTSRDDVIQAFAIRVGVMTRLVAQKLGTNAFEMQEIHDAIALLVHRVLANDTSPAMKARIAPTAIRARVARRRKAARRGLYGFAGAAKFGRGVKLIGRFGSITTKETMMSAKRAVLVERKGRRRKIAERYPSGDVKRRGRGDPRDLGIYNRCKESRSRFWQDRALESEIGRLHQVQKVIGASEAEALFELGRHLGRYQRLLGFPRPVARSAAFDLGYSGPSDYIVPAELERQARTEKRLHERIRDVIPSETAWDLLHAVCAENRHVNPIHAADIARLARAVATVLANRSAPGKVQKAKPRPSRSPAQRAAILVGMLEDYFAECGHRVEEWSLIKAEEGAAERGIIGYGAGGFQHSVTMHRGDAPAAEFDMAIIRAAEAKGWRARQ